MADKQSCEEALMVLRAKLTGQLTDRERLFVDPTEEDNYDLHQGIDDDPVNHPSYYTRYQGLEIIDLTEQMNFNRGSVVKYVVRAGFKNPEDEIQDLEKASWYLRREIERLTRLSDRHNEGETNG